jgi:hypothetical protein
LLATVSKCGYCADKKVCAAKDEYHKDNEQEACCQARNHPKDCHKEYFFQENYIKEDTDLCF